MKKLWSNLKAYFAKRRNKTFYITFVSQVLLATQFVLHMLGHDNVLTAVIQHQILNYTNIVLTLLATLGVVNDPTVKGLKDK
jgi:phi LC3 family holin